MTTNPPDRWAIASLNLDALRDAQLEKNLGHQMHKAVLGLPSSTTSTFVYDRDGVLLIEIRCFRHDGQAIVEAAMKDIAPQLRQLGWRPNPAPNAGRFEHHRADGVGTLPGCWATWERVEVERG